MDYYLTGEETNRNQKTSSSRLYDEDETLMSGMPMEELGISHQRDEPMDQALQSQYAAELKQVEEEIKTLQQVLTARFARQHFLRRQLGITVISELREEVIHGIENLRSSDAYQRTSAAVKTAKDKTSAAIQEKWSLIKGTGIFKSLEEKVAPAYSSVRGKLMRSSVTSQPNASSNSSGDVATTDEQPAQSVTKANEKEYKVEVDGNNPASDADAKGEQTYKKRTGAPGNLRPSVDDDDQTEREPLTAQSEAGAAGSARRKPQNQAKQPAKRSGNTGPS